MTEITIANTTEEQSQELALLSQAHAALMQASTVDEVRHVRDRADAVRSYAKKARLGREMVVEASALRLRSERRLGQLLQQLPLAKGSPGNQYKSVEAIDEEPSQVRLQDVGITKSDSSRLQRIAAVPEDRFQAYVRECLDAGRECSTAACLRLLGPRKTVNNAGSSKRSRTSPALQALLQQSTRFATLFANPFAAEHGFGMSVDVGELSRQPVEKLATANSHLYFLTPAPRLAQALQLVDAWGFEYSFCLPWRAEASELAPVESPWASELLLIGRRGTPVLAELIPTEWERLTSKGFNNDSLLDLIERLSHGPYLDLTSNAAPVNEHWTTISGGRVG